jgi:hypothetical protein
MQIDAFSRNFGFPAPATGSFATQCEHFVEFLRPIVCGFPDVRYIY